MNSDKIASVIMIFLFLSSILASSGCLEDTEDNDVDNTENNNNNGNSDDNQNNNGDTGNQDNNGENQNDDSDYDGYNDDIDDFPFSEAYWMN